MLAFNHLGNLGRLGNQMFEYAALRGIAAVHGYDWCIPPYNAQSIENYSLHYCFKMEDVDPNHLGMLGTGHFIKRDIFIMMIILLMVVLIMLVFTDSFNLKNTLRM